MIIWISLPKAHSTDFVSSTHQLLLLFILVYCPLFLILSIQMQPTNPKQTRNLNYFVQLLQPFASLICMSSLLTQPGNLSGILAIVWMAYSTLVAYMGVTHFRVQFQREKRFHKHTLCVCAGILNNWRYVFRNRFNVVVIIRPQFVVIRYSSIILIIIILPQ